VGQQYYFESKKATFLTGGSYDHCIKYFDVWTKFILNTVQAFSKITQDLTSLIDQKVLKRQLKNVKTIYLVHMEYERCIIKILTTHILWNII
jgi:hypothetical protein